MSDNFGDAVKLHQSAFGLALADDAIERLTAYYELIQQHNPILHLVAPCTPEEFAIRHILESLTLLEHLPKSSRFADVGTGAGLPSIPCLLVREDMRAVLIESKEKKTKFLDNVAATLGIANRATVINRQFEEVEAGQIEYVTCRALDKFTEKLPRLLKWARSRSVLLFGGNRLCEALQKQKVEFEAKLMPMSEQRFLFIRKGK